MLKFKETNTATSVASTAYKAVPDHATSAISSGLDRLFGTPASSRTVSRESSGSSVPGQRTRALKGVRQELDEYLEDPLQTFSRIEQVDGIEKRVVFDLLAYWQVRAIFSISCKQF